ncbi:hypothetical protein COLO4_03149 [Corchorus olitorius]|uniref:Uncharacterized protein n=1 Tax=Corchorus olitorius TaxID=93759 RepID=A0A1R3KZE0_9ROSI|nr:hypothetical protein COLO4_03149 [Corchorus olitorius]
MSNPPDSASSRSSELGRNGKSKGSEGGTKSSGFKGWSTYCSMRVIRSGGNLDV